MQQKFYILVILAFIISALNSSAQIPNSGFENWTTDEFGNLNPVGWETTNNSPDISVDPYVPSKQGNYAMRVKTFDPGFIPVGGIAFAEFPYNLRPTLFSGWIKTTVMPGDAVYVIVSLWKGDSIIASPGNCTFSIDSTITDYFYFTFPLTYQSALIPDSANIMVVAGTSGNTMLGTEIIVDELAFVLGVGIEKRDWVIPAFLGQNYPNPASHKTVIPFSLIKGSEVDIQVFNTLGIRVKIVELGFMESGRYELQLSLDNLPDGAYQYMLSGGGFKLSGKLMIIR